MSLMRNLFVMRWARSTPIEAVTTVTKRPTTNLKKNQIMINDL